jgi:hypothetical protein
LTGQIGLLISDFQINDLNDKKAIVHHNIELFFHDMRSKAGKTRKVKRDSANSEKKCFFVDALLFLQFENFDFRRSIFVFSILIFAADCLLLAFENHFSCLFCRCFRRCKSLLMHNFVSCSAETLNCKRSTIAQHESLIVDLSLMSYSVFTSSTFDRFVSVAKSLFITRRVSMFSPNQHSNAAAENTQQHDANQEQEQLQDNESEFEFPSTQERVNAMFDELRKLEQPISTSAAQIDQMLTK